MKLFTQSRQQVRMIRTNGDGTTVEAETGGLWSRERHDTFLDGRRNMLQLKQPDVKSATRKPIRVIGPHRMCPLFG